jgi:hypothetical protein
MVIDEFCFSGGLLPPPKKKTTRKKTTRKKKKKTSLVYCSLLYSIIYSKICEMLCRCKSCVVKEEEEEDDAKVFRKSPSTKQNKGAKDTFEKFKIFTDRFWCVMCVC